MTESTGYLDMNKKNLCHPNKINQLSFVLFFKKGIFVFQTEPNSIDRSIASNPKKTSHPNPQETLFHPLSPTRFDPKKKISMLFSKKKFFFHPRPGFELTLKRSWFPPQRAPSARRGRRFPARARAPAAAAAAAAAAAHQHHHLIESGSEKREGYRTSVSTKIRSVSNLCMNPNPLSPRSPFFSTNWSAVSHPSQRVIPLRHVSVTKCPLFADLSPRSPFPRPVSGFPNKNT